MFKLKTPLRKEFPIKVKEGDDFFKAGDAETPDCFVSFRQATIAQVEQRTEASNNRKWVSEGDNKMALIDNVNFDKIARLEVFLTLCNTDIVFEDGTRVSFTEGSAPAVVERPQFDAWWDAMNLQQARFIHKCCLEVNPDWAPKRDDNFQRN